VVSTLDEAGNPVAAVSSTEVQARPEGQEESQERQPRERRSRDRYGRDRRERGERSEQAVEGQDALTRTNAFEANPAAQAHEERAPAAAQLQAPMAAAPEAAASPAPAPSPAPAASALPKVQPYDLPLQDLAQVAQSSGLQWVNSDTAKIAEAKAAIAAEVKPIQLPRERPAQAVAQDAPLVLVETRRDLGSMPLPFEKPAD
jgi:ribonuclease E